MISPDQFNIIYSAEDIAKRVKALGAQISKDYEGSIPILISMLKGSVFFLSDLSRAITIPHYYDFIGIYGINESAGGTDALNTTSPRHQR